jgi:hypothetical protein
MGQGHTLLLGTRKGLFVFSRANGDYQLVEHAFHGVPVAYATLDERTGALWACLDHGHWGQKLSRSVDGGKTWEETPAPQYPKGAVIRDDTPAALRYLWILQPGGADQPGRLYLGTEPGGLFVSDDNGDSWRLCEPLWNHPTRQQWFGGGRDEAGIHSIVIDPRDSRRLFIGVSCGGVYETLDDGASWTTRNKGLIADFLPDPDSEVGQDPHLVVGCPTHPEVLWQQNHCGIFRSVDAGQKWSLVSQKDGPAHFGFAIAVDERDPDTAWVVPAISDEIRMAVEGKLCVCRTTDGGRSWEDLRRGLPQDLAYDIVLRHALDLAGDHLAFGSTTGNVFFSDDRGDHWHCLGNHLPPVYSLRFA